MDISTAISTVKKAIAGAAVAAIIALLARYNVIIDSSLGNALEVIVSAIIGFVVVYLAPKNAEPKQ